jgi:hypothetical protein
MPSVKVHLEKGVHKEPVIIAVTRETREERTGGKRFAHGDRTF